MDLDYNVKIVYHVDNTFCAKIYKDFMNCFALEIDHHPYEFDATPFVNYKRIATWL